MSPLAFAASFPCRQISPWMSCGKINRSHSSHTEF
jgi:hypothetical protein